MSIPFSKVSLGDTIYVYVNDSNIICTTPQKSYIVAHVAGLYYVDISKTVISSVLLGWKKDEQLPLSYEYIEKIPSNGWPCAFYSIEDDIKSYVCGTWVRGVKDDLVFVDYANTWYGNGKIIPNTTSKFIEAYEIRPGDTVAWMTENGQLNYAFVYSEISEDEIDERPVVVLDAEVYCCDGQRSFPHGYPMHKNYKVLLVDRKS